MLYEYGRFSRLNQSILQALPCMLQHHMTSLHPLEVRHTLHASLRSAVALACRSTLLLCTRHSSVLARCEFFGARPTLLQSLTSQHVMHWHQAVDAETRMLLVSVKGDSVSSSHPLPEGQWLAVLCVRLSWPGCVRTQGCTAASHAISCRVE